LPRHADPDLEQKILEAASGLWARGGEKSLTMRAIAKAAGTTTPTVYERYRNREDILRALRLKTRSELFTAICRTRSLRQAVESYVRFALAHQYAYEVLFDAVGKPPSLHEPWPTFNFLRERVAKRVGGSVAEHTRLMLSLWCLMHGAAMLIIRGRFEGALRVQTIHACLDTIEAVLQCARRKQITQSGPKFPANLVLGKAEKSRVGDGAGRSGGKR
jgi:AcrR family transcriptional regulator